MLLKNLLYTIYFTQSSCFLSGKKPFSIIGNTWGCFYNYTKRFFLIKRIQLVFSLWNIYRFFIKKTRITVMMLVTFQEEHLLNWNNLGLLCIHTFSRKIIFKLWVSYMINQAFEEYLFVHVWILLYFVALYVLKLQSFDLKTKHVIFLAI